MMHKRAKFYAEDGPEFRDEIQMCHTTNYAREHGLRFCKLAGIGDWDYLLRETKLKATIRRTSFGVLGGLFLIVPMLIMKFYPSRNTSLITASISTLIFILFVSIFSGANEQAVLAIVAAYTAVLVVLVGTSL